MAACVAGSLSLAIDTARVQMGNLSEVQASVQPTAWMSLCSHSSLPRWKIILPQVVGRGDVWSWLATMGMDSSESFGKPATDMPDIVFVLFLQWRVKQMLG